MRKVITLLIITSSILSSKAQDTDQYLDKVKTLDSTLNTLYEVISGEKGEERNWELFHYLFTPDAKLIPSGRNKEGKVKHRFITPAEYVETSGQWLVENGFYELEISRKVDSFGNIVQVFSTYESYHSKKDDNPFTRGINSVQLLNDGERYWIVNIYWTSETEENPIPEKYLTKKN